MRGAGPKLSTLSMVIAVIAIAPSREASAQPRPAVVANPPRAAPSTPRFRLGAGTHGGYARFGIGAAASWLLAGYVRAGAQVSDLFAIDAQFAGGWLALMYYARANVYADFTVASRVSLAVGPTYSQGAFGEGSGSMTGASARFTVLPVSERLENGVRLGFSISVEADVGVSLTEGCYCAPPFLSRAGNLAWGVYGGLGLLRF